MRPFTEEDADPRALWHLRVSELAVKLRENPTLPQGVKSPWRAGNFEECWRSIEALPTTHCAFAQCGWVGESEEALCEHLLEMHEEDLLPCVRMSTSQSWWRRDRSRKAGQVDREMRMLAYTAALSAKSRAQAPIACPQIDRRALLQWSHALNDSNIYTLICFFCA